MYCFAPAISQRITKEQYVQLYKDFAIREMKRMGVPASITLAQGILIDADKVSYIDYYELTLPKIKQNGLIIADNVLFHGEVLEEKIKGKNAKAIHAFNLHVARDMRVEQVMLTVRDGLMLIRKL